MKIQENPQMLKKTCILTLAFSISTSLGALADILLVGGHEAGIVAAYNTSTGEVINPEFIKGLEGPYGITHDSSTVYVANTYAGTVGKYDVETGAVDSAQFISGLKSPTGLVVHNGILYVASSIGPVASYNADTGELINSSLVAVNGSRMIAVHNDKLYVGDFTEKSIGVYGLDGTAVNARLVSEINPGGFAFSGSSMFVTCTEPNAVREYDATTGESIGVPISSGLSDPIGLVVDSDGQLFVANATGGSGSVSRFMADGTIVENPLIVDVRMPMGLDRIQEKKPAGTALP
jgi:sugar lactone lactonase YvrE